jgi:hypothetical protein
MAVTDYQPTRVGKGSWKWGGFVHASTRMSVPALLWTLHDMGGVIEDASGKAPTKLAQMALSRGFAVHASHHGGQGLSTLMAQLERGRMAGCIERELNGKRTLKITLLLNPEELPPRPAIRKPQIGDSRPAPGAVAQPKQRSVFVQPVPDAPDTEGPYAAVPEPEPTEPEPVPVPDAPDRPQPRPDDPNVATTLAVVEDPAEAPVEPVEPVIPPLVLLSPEDDPIARLFAIQNDLVAATMAIATMAAPVVHEVMESADPKQAERLAQTLEENNRLRAKVNTLTETVRAKTAEADAFKRQVLVLQNNLRAMTDASNEAAKRERDLAKLRGNQRFISERPEPAIAGRR